MGASASAVDLRRRAGRPRSYRAAAQRRGLARGATPPAPSAARGGAALARAALVAAVTASLGAASLLATPTAAAGAQSRSGGAAEDPWAGSRFVEPATDSYGAPPVLATATVAFEALVLHRSARSGPLTRFDSKVVALEGLPEGCEVPAAPAMPSPEQAVQPVAPEDPPGATRYRLTGTVEAACNGRYQLEIVAGAADGSSVTLQTEFEVAAPGPSPRNLEASLDEASRAVTLSWAPPANPPPDLIGYRVERAGDGGAFSALFDLSAESTAYVDRRPPEQGGAVVYRVLSLRWGASAMVASDAASAPFVRVEVAAAQPTPGAAASGPLRVTSAPPAAPPEVASARAAPGGVMQPAQGTPGAPRAPDTGFSRELPFAGPGSSATEVAPALGGPVGSGASAGYERLDGGLAVPSAIALVLAAWALLLRHIGRLGRR